MGSLPRAAEGRPAVELTDLSDDDLMELGGGGHSDAHAAGGAAQPVTATLPPHGTEDVALEPAPAAGDGGAAGDAMVTGEATTSAPTARLLPRKRGTRYDASRAYKRSRKD